MRPLDPNVIWPNLAPMFPIRDHNLSATRPIVTIALILANVAIFLVTQPLSNDPNALWRLYEGYALIPARLSAGQGYETLVTSMFLHGGYMHIIGNMLFLWIFGDNLEDMLGHVGFALFYLACGVGAGVAHWLSDPGSGVPTVGASGAIAGVMGGYLLLFPRARVDVLFFFVVFFRIFPMPAWIMLGVWFAMQLYGGASVDVSGGGVAYWAHAGGFLIGLVLVLPTFLRRGGPAFWARTHGHPDHEPSNLQSFNSNIPRVRRKR